VFLLGIGEGFGLYFPTEETGGFERFGGGL